MTATPGTARTTVAVCSYNRAPLLERALASLLDGLPRDARIVVVDNASGDGSPNVARRMGVDVVVNSTNLGMVGNWNRAIELVTGEYGAVFHDDDEYVPGAVARLSRALDDAPSASFVHSGVTMIDGAGVAIEEPPLLRGGVRPGPEVAREIAETGTPFVFAPTVLFRRAAIQRAGPFDASFHLAADFDMWSRLAFEGDVAYVPERLLRYRQHGGSGTTVSTPVTAALECRRIQEAAAARLGPSLGVSRRALLAARIRYFHFARLASWVLGGWGVRPPQEPATLKELSSRARVGFLEERLFAAIVATPPLRAAASAYMLRVRRRLDEDRWRLARSQGATVPPRSLGR